MSNENSFEIYFVDLIGNKILPLPYMYDFLKRFFLFVRRKRRRLGCREFAIRRYDRWRNIRSLSRYHHHLFGHLSSHRNRSLPRSSWSASHTNRKFAYHSDWLRRFEQSEFMFFIFLTFSRVDLLGCGGRKEEREQALGSEIYHLN